MPRPRRVIRNYAQSTADFCLLWRCGCSHNALWRYRMNNLLERLKLMNLLLDEFIGITHRVCYLILLTCCFCLFIGL